MCFNVQWLYSAMDVEEGARVQEVCEGRGGEECDRKEVEKGKGG